MNEQEYPDYLDIPRSTGVVYAQEVTLDGRPLFDVVVRASITTVLTFDVEPEQYLRSRTEPTTVRVVGVANNEWDSQGFKSGVLRLTMSGISISGQAKLETHSKTGGSIECVYSLESAAVGVEG